MRRLIGAGALASLLSASAADAAVLSGVSGQVLVNSGHGYTPASEGMHLNAGDSIIANPGATAQVVYPGGTTVAVEAGNVVVVLEDAHAAAVLGDAAAAGAAGAGGMGATALVVGGLAVAGVVGVVASASNSRDKPASP